MDETAGPGRYAFLEFDAPLSNRARQRAESWLRGYRDVLGFAYLTLGPARALSRRR